MLAQNDPEGAADENAPPKETVKKSTSKVVRVLTVLAYLMSVSMAAILLSIYYLCIWKSPVLSDLQDVPTHHHQQASQFDYQTGYINNDSVPFNFTGGSSTTVNDTDIQLPPSDVTYPDEHQPSEQTTATEPSLFNSTFQYNGTTKDINTSNGSFTPI